jgi:hypothetical protein
MPINRELHAALAVRFGRVQVEKEGEKWMSRKLPDPYDQTRLVEQVVNKGEHYKVCCPFCGDHGFHLYVNHCWGMVTAFGKSGGRHLVCCFKCGFEQQPGGLDRFEEMLQLYLLEAPPAPQAAAVGSEWEPLAAAAMPGTCISLSELPVNHVAPTFLRNRGFDLADLHEHWGVRWCVDAPEPWRTASRRLVFPAWWQGRLVGWQCRAVEEGRKPKYYTMPHMAKRLFLYNGDHARKHRFGVVVEGPMDCIRLGGRAVAVWGTSVSEHQQRLIHTWWGNGAVCILLDGDAWDKAEKMVQLLNPHRFRGGVFAVKLENGIGPSRMDRQELEELIANAARSRGISLTGD